MNILLKSEFAFFIRK